MDLTTLSNSLELGTLEKGSRIIVAMSGGVDSSLTAAALHALGYEVIGITLQLYNSVSSCSVGKQCCADRDIEDARKVAEKIGFPHYVMNYQSKFNESVIQYFVDSYSRGETPLPCVKCNQSVKFVDLLACAKKLNGTALATGHYVRRVETGIDSHRKTQLHRAEEDGKDQSYFLFATTQEQLDFLRFPLGGISKSMTREYARYFNLDIAEKGDSQDICFVPDGDYAGFIGKIRPDLLKSGEIINTDGDIIGEHRGTINYTIGQRKGIGISHEKPLFVVKIDPTSNKITVGDKNSLARSFIEISEINLLEDLDKIHQMDISVKIRSTHKPISAKLLRQDQQSESFNTSSSHADQCEQATSHDTQEKLIIKLDGPEYGIAPGQACVIYSGTRVLGGGWIKKSW